MFLQLFCGGRQLRRDAEVFREMIERAQHRVGREATQRAQGTKLHGVAKVREQGEILLALLAGDWLPKLGDIAARHPGLKLTAAHMGALRGAKGDPAFPKMKELTSLAKYPNVSLKLTGGPFYADDPYPFKSLHKHYRAMYDAFGPRRIFWGTDITKMPCSWRECVTHFQEIDWIPEADKKLMMVDAVCDWFGWKRKLRGARRKRSGGRSMLGRRHGA